MGGGGDIFDGTAYVAADLDEQLRQVSTDGILPFRFLPGGFREDACKQKLCFRIGFGVQHGVGENGVVVENAVAIARLADGGNFG